MKNHLILLVIFLFIFLPISSHADPLPSLADKILIYKSKREMVLFHHNRPFKTYTIALGAHPKGHKKEEGDEKTPEGTYWISGRNAHSRFHLSLKISYPNAHDLMQAQERGVSAGGDIMVHGLPDTLGWLGKLHLRWPNWTDGCIAVTNQEIEEIWRLVPDNTPIEILP